MSQPERDRPWLFRTYAGHSSAADSNRLFRDNLARGQTGLSVAFDLPTQTGYDPDDVMAVGEVGKVGVPIAHLGDMRALFDKIPLERMNTSMTINATAPWLMALYVATAEEQGAARKTLAGTTQNDIVKEYLSRGTYIFAPDHSLRLTSDLITWCYRETPRWNPINVCSYHLQEAGATPVQELAFSLANAFAVIDAVRESGQVSDQDLPQVIGRLSFFVNAGIRFITEICKMRAFTTLWDSMLETRYGVADPKLRRFRYGVQVNSLGLTEQQPENNVPRILLEMLAVVLSKDARARAVQLPAWNEALGLPRPWDQQWSLRMQQIVAYETDLLEFGDIFNGSHVIEAKVRELCDAAREEIARIDEMGGLAAAIESGYLKRALVASHAERRRRIEAGEDVIVGVNRYEEGAPSPLAESNDGGFLTVAETVERDQRAAIAAWRSKRDDAAVQRALSALEAAAREGCNVMDPSLDCARAGVTTGEWGETLRRVFGQYRASTGLDEPAGGATTARVDKLAGLLGRRPRILVGKPGLDGHSNGAEQIALRARDLGFEVVYEGIRQTPDEIADLARDQAVDLVGLSILSGSHLPLVRAVRDALVVRECGNVPIVVGGIIPLRDREELAEMGVTQVFTSKDYDLNTICDALADLLETRLELSNAR